MTDVDWNFQLAEQLDLHWREQLRPRLNGLTDEEYRWEPVPGAWNVRPRGTGTAPVAAGAGEFTIDFAMPEPDPPPVTTIAWRLGHIVVGVLGMRVASHFGGPPAGYATHRYPGDAATALAHVLEPPPHGFETWEDFGRSIGMPEEEFGDQAAVIDPADEGPRLYFQRVPERKIVKNRVHLDVRVAGREVDGEERKRLVSE